jgi:hypothetical protein
MPKAHIELLRHEYETKLVEKRQADEQLGKFVRCPAGFGDGTTINVTRRERSLGAKQAALQGTLTELGHHLTALRRQIRAAGSTTEDIDKKHPSYGQGEPVAD